MTSYFGDEFLKSSISRKPCLPDQRYVTYFNRVYYNQRLTQTKLRVIEKLNASIQTEIVSIPIYMLERTCKLRVRDAQEGRHLMHIILSRLNNYKTRGSQQSL